MGEVSLMTVDENTRLTILSDHYNQTFALQKGDVRRRDLLLLYILILIFVILLYILAPNTLGDWINSFLANQINNQNHAAPPAVIDVSFIGAILWFGLLSLAHTYFQTVLHVERQYAYIYSLEKELSAYFDGKAFTREGEHYRQYKRRFSSLTKFIFWILFPVLLFVFVILWLLFLYSRSLAPLGYLVFDTAIAAIILISEGLYLLALYKKK
jgi:hypothetical protein